MSGFLGHITIYVKDIETSVAFYEKYFGFVAHRAADDRIVELTASGGGARILLHQSAKGQKMGQVLVKLGFDVEDIEAFVADAAANGLKFGARHKGDGYSFANAKDPSGNSIAISSRAFRVKA